MAKYYYAQAQYVVTNIYLITRQPCVSVNLILQLHIQLVHITTQVVNSNLAQGEVYSIKH